MIFLLLKPLSYFFYFYQNDYFTFFYLDGKWYIINKAKIKILLKLF